MEWNKKIDEIKQLKLDLQYFSDGSEGAEGEESGGGADSKPEGEPDKVELTQEELNKKIESESDRKLESAKKKWMKEWQEETERKIQEAIEEKERLSKLSEKERKEEELTQREKDIAKKLAELERRELKADAMAELAEKGYPSEFNDFLAETLLGNDAEETLEKIKKFHEIQEKITSQKVKEKLRQDTPPFGSGSGGKPKVNSFAKMRNEQDKVQNQAPNPWGN